MDPNAYPFHIKCGKHCIYVRGDIHFWLVHSVTHYLTGLFMPGHDQECWLTFEDLSQEMWWCQCKIHTHTPIHNIKCVAKTLFMLCMNVTSIIYLVSKPYHFTMVKAVEPFKLHPTSMSHTYIRCVGGTFCCCGWAYGCTHIPYRYHHRYLPRFERIGWNPCPWLCMCLNHATMLWVRLYLYQSTFRTASHIHFIHI